MANLQLAVQRFREKDVEVVLHCGDLTQVEVAMQLVEFRVICTFGNGDWNANEIRRSLMAFRPDNFGDMVFRGSIAGVRIAATHGHLQGMVEALAACGEYDFVFYGHSHRRKVERVQQTQVVNPGALGGLHPEARSCAILDLQSGQLDVQILE